MPRSTNPFVKQVYFWWIIAPVLSVIIFPALGSVDSLKIKPEEIQLANRCNDDIDDVNQSATNHFDSWFVKTGWVAHSIQENVNAENSVATGYAWLGRTMHTWYGRFWLYAYRVIWRWTAFWPLYIAGVLGIATPCLVDGLVIRAKKRYEFGQYNPMAFNVSGTLFSLAVGWLLYVPLLPLPLTENLMACFFLGLGAVAWISTANFQRSA